MKKAIVVFIVCIICSSATLGNTVAVRNAEGLRIALARVKPGTTITLASGDYGSGLQLERIQGSKENPILIIAADPQHPPVFQGGGQAMHFVDCNYVTLRHVKVAGCTLNGINADDGGTFDTPSRGMIFEGLTIEHVGPQGNHDGLKLSGLRGFVVSNCTFSGWGGSAIDMVGCQEGMIENCQFIGKEGFSQSSGIQAKGGSEAICIRKNVFKNAGERAINLGGSTGLAYFRPHVRNYEAQNIVVEGNRFFGSLAPIAYVTSTTCTVQQNTFILPDKWVLRILQEQPTERFLPCQQGIFKNNLIIFDKRIQVFVNVGPSTKPETFSFSGNAWVSIDGDRRPSLPVNDQGSISLADPMRQEPDQIEAELISRNPKLRGVGAHAFKR